jgi:hypothetical protein
MVETDFGKSSELEFLENNEGFTKFEQRDKVKIIETAKGKLHFELSMLTLDCALIEAKIKEIQGVMMRNEREI